MKIKIYFIYAAFTAVAFFLSAETKAAIYYSNTGATITAGANGLVGFTTTPGGVTGGPFTLAGGDDIVIQSGTTASTAGSASIFCKNLTIDGTLTSSATAYIKFAGLFSGSGIISGTKALYTNGGATINFAGTMSNSLTINGNTALAGNLTIGNSVAFSGAFTLDLAGYNLSATGVTCTATGLLKGNIASNLTLSATATLYFDQTTPGTTNAMASITFGGFGSLCTPVVIYKYINHTSSSSLNINAVGTGGTTGAVTLISDNTGTAYILCPNSKIYASGGGGVAPTITIQQYLSAKRGWRLLGNPINGTITLSTFATQSNIDVNNGQTSATTAYSYDGTIISPLSPWTASGASWAANKGLLLFVRGSAGQGLSGGAYSPDNVVLSTTGTMGRGTIAAQNLTYDATNTNAQWNIIANPYPAAVSAKALTGLYGNANINQSIYFLNPNKIGGNAYEANGNYEFVTLSGSQDFIIPSFGAIMVQTQAASQSIQFTEAAKSILSSNQNLYRTTNVNRLFAELKLINTEKNIVVDKVELMQDNNCTTIGNDHWDLPKISLKGENLYTYSSTDINNTLAIDARKDFLQDTIALGMNVLQGKSYQLKVGNYNLPLNTQLLLKDKITGMVTTIEEGMEYSFNVQAGSALMDLKTRFEIYGQRKILSPLELSNVNGIKLYPNPSASLFVIDWKDAPACYETKYIKITNALGKTVKVINDVKNTFSISINLQEMPTGIYYVSMVNANGTTITVKSVQKN